MYKAVIIDDEPLACELVKEYLNGFADIECMAVCHDGFEGLKAISTHKPDLVFLDVQMPKITGFEMLELLDDAPSVIFTTAFDQYALKAFEAQAVDYLLKPFSLDRFKQAVTRFLERGVDAGRAQTEKLLQDQKLERLVVRDDSRIRIIPLQDISFLEAEDDYVHIHSSHGKFTKKKTLSSYQDQLPASLFLRVHRSYLVNMQQITRIDPYEKSSHVATLINGTKIPVSKSGYQMLKEALKL